MLTRGGFPMEILEPIQEQNDDQGRFRNGKAQQ
jgi:hypothetical protein